MWIKSLHLKNLQCHEDLELNFENGINIIHGSTDSGKSAVRRALEFICDINVADGLRKSGSKQTSVCITLHNDVELERVRSASINRYIIRKDDEEKVYDAVGKNAPDEVIEVLGIRPIEVDGEKIYLNSSPQLGLPFLFDKSPSFRSKLFNKLTGNDQLDILLSQFNKDILKFKRNLKEETERFEERTIQIKDLTKTVEKTEVIYNRLKKQISHIKDIYQKYSKLLELKELYEKNIENIKTTTNILKTFKFPEAQVLEGLREKIIRFDLLNTAKIALEKSNFNLNRVRDQLKDYRLPEVNIEGLKGKIERFDTLKSIYEKVDKNQKMCYTIQEDIKKGKIALKEAEQSYKKLLKEAKICPICKTELNDKHLQELHL